VIPNGPVRGLNCPVELGQSCAHFLEPFRDLSERVLQLLRGLPGGILAFQVLQIQIGQIWGDQSDA